MSNRIDDAIYAYLRGGDLVALDALYIALVEEKLSIPLLGPVKEVAPGRHDLPVLCIKTEDGGGAIPAFTSAEHLLEWKPEGCLHTEVVGRSLVAMAIGMSSISEIVINMNGVPRGSIPRSGFARMLTLK
jgi:SseB protein N-terminal domain